MSKILIISDRRSLDTIEETYIDVSLSEKYQIIGWRVDPIFEKGDREKFKDQNFSYKKVYIASLKEFEEKLEQDKPKIKVVLYFGFPRPAARALQAILNKAGLTWGRFFEVPSFIPRGKTKIMASKRYLQRRKYEIQNRVSIKPNFIAAVGKNAEVLLSEAGRFKQLSLVGKDLERYKKQCKTTTPTNNHIVYIDQNLVEHHDFKDRPHLALPDYTYYKQLAAVLKQMEKSVGQTVKIALHYNNDSEKFAEVFKAFECVRGKTNELVQQASLVMGHFSGALSFAVLARKPIVLFGFEKAYRYCRKSTLAMSKKLNVPVLGIRDDLPQLDLSTLDNTYETYISNYLDNGASELSNKERLLNYIETELSK